jgi:O-antigen ligase
MLKSDDMPMARKMLEFKLSLALFPLFHFISRTYTKDQTTRILSFFCFGVTGFTLFTFALALGKFLSNGDFSFVGYDQLAFKFHPTYLSMYVCLTAFIYMHRGLKKQYFFGGRTNHYIIIAFLFIYLGFLGSKAGLGAGALVIVIALVEAKIRLENRRFHWVGIGIAAMALLGSILMAPNTTKRIETALNTEVVQNDNVARNSSQIRLLAWQTAWEIIRENPLGVGTGDSSAELNEKYAEQGETYALKRSFNSHNQFFQSGVENGWPAIVILILLFITGLRWAWKWKDWVFGTFLLVLGFNMLFESILEVQAGVVFFSFFMMIFQNRKQEEVMME